MPSKSLRYSHLPTAITITPPAFQILRVNIERQVSKLLLLLDLVVFWRERDDDDDDDDEPYPEPVEYEMTPLKDNVPITRITGRPSSQCSRVYARSACVRTRQIGTATTTITTTKELTSP